MKSRALSHQKKQPQPNQISQLLNINQQYHKLLQTLGDLNFCRSQVSTQSYLFQTLQSLKQLGSCMKQQMILLDKSSNKDLDDFIQRKDLINSSNLIAKYQNFNDEIEIFKEEIESLNKRKSERQALEAIEDEEQQLIAELEKLTNRRIELRNKNQMISYQIECGENDLREAKVKTYEEQLKLRKMEKNVRNF